jgi:hypothetical protein
MTIKSTAYQILKRPVLTTMLVFVLLTTGTGCSNATATPQPTPHPRYSVSPLFRTFYDWGGEKSFGRPISPEISEGNIKYQWLEKGKMVFNPQAEVAKFSFGPLGRDMGVEGPAVPAPVQPELHYLGGHTIHPDFWPKYEELGAHMVGLPLTEARYNPVRRRYEQYFENLGFYRLIGHPDVHLLNYGVWACGDECIIPDSGDDYVASIDPAGTIDVFGSVDSVFVEVIDWVGSDLIGSDLTAAYTRDGTLEQVFENAVLMTDNLTDPSSVQLRALSTDLNIYPERPKSYEENPGMQFVVVDGDLGYEIPNYFWEYIQDHGGLEITGSPITHLTQLDARTSRQCFTNLCLIYVPDEIENMRVRPEALGYVYRLLYPPPEAAPQTSPIPAKEITTVKVWESFSTVGSTQPQEIAALLFSNNEPVLGAAMEVMLIMPDGSQQFYAMPPTDENGRTSILLTPIRASNGTLIEYQVCIPQSGQQKICIADSFLIWNNR